MLKVYIDTSVIISLTDPLDVFHEQSMVFTSKLTRNEIESNISAPLVVELGKIAEIKGTKRCLAILNAIEDSRMRFKDVDLKKVWNLSQLYVDAHVLTVRHRVDLFHYAAASLVDCTHLASWNSRQFNEKVAAGINTVNSKQGLSSLIVGKPGYIVRRENLG